MNIEDLKQKALAANNAHRGLPWQVTMARHDGITHYHVRGHCEPAISVIQDGYWEDDYSPPVDEYGYIQPDERMDCDQARVDIARYIAAANPAAVLGLIQQRNELLAALDLFMEVVRKPPEANCSCHISPPCNDCVDYSGLREAFSVAEEAIANADTQS